MEKREEIFSFNASRKALSGEITFIAMIPTFTIVAALFRVLNRNPAWIHIFGEKLELINYLIMLLVFLISWILVFFLISRGRPRKVEVGRQFVRINYNKKPDIKIEHSKLIEVHHWNNTSRR